MRGNFLTSCKPVNCSRRTLHHGVSKCVQDDDDDDDDDDIARYGCPCSRHEFLCKNGVIAPLVLTLSTGHWNTTKLCVSHFIT